MSSRRGKRAGAPRTGSTARGRVSLGRGEGVYEVYDATRPASPAGQCARGRGRKGKGGGYCECEERETGNDIVAIERRDKWNKYGKRPERELRTGRLEHERVALCHGPVDEGW